MSRQALWENTDINLYAVLGIDEDASESEVVSAWRRTAKRLHPDLGGSSAQFQRAERAYRVLSDPRARRQYDNWRSAQSAAFTRRQGPDQRSARQNNTQPNYSYMYATYTTTANPGAQNGARRRSPMTVLFLVIVVLVAVLAAAAFAIMTPVLILAGLIWLVSRALNPRGSRGP